MSEDHYLIIECKNQSITQSISKEYCGQLLNSINWFRDEYKANDRNIKYTPILVHPSNIFDYHASPSDDIRIITETELNKLIFNIRNFISSILNQENYDEIYIKNHINILKLNPENFVENYTVQYKKI